MKERDLQKKIVKWLNAQPDCWVTPTATGSMGPQRVGTPDIIGHFKGLFIALEVKRKGAKTTMIQQHTLNKILAAGAAPGLVGVVCSLEEVQRCIEISRPKIEQALDQERRMHRIFKEGEDGSVN